jgi:serine/threonine-protein kinase HipA
LSAPTAHVYVDLDGTPHLAGRLWTSVRGARQAATFEYDEAWQADPRRFALEPALQLGPGTFHTPEGRSIFAALGDSAPDRWGRTLIARNERRLARSERRVPRTLFEMDFVLAVSDFSRQGALRFARDEGGPFLAPDGETVVPPLVELPRLLAASDHVLTDTEGDEDLRLLLAPGSSLGGARPKASVLETDGSLAIAKFPASSDPYPVVLWEAVALELAAAAGITVPEWRLHDVDGRAVLILRRFDRKEQGQVRRPFLSAMSMLGSKDGDQRSYPEIADALRRYGARTRRDLAELWRRMVFNVLISNTDDHLRNHGFLYQGTDGWVLSPAYDLNPTPVDLKPRVLSTTIDVDGDPSASIELALEVTGYFDLDRAGARKIVREVSAAISRWSEVARRVGLAAGDCSRLETAFEHADAELARRI